MLVYRFEHVDGGSIYFTLDGKFRDDPTLDVDPDGWIAGCLSLQDLFQYIALEPAEKIDGLILKVYNIDEEDVKGISYLPNGIAVAQFSNKYAYKGRSDANALCTN